MILLQGGAYNEQKKITGGTGITAGRDVIFDDVRGQVAIGENITQIQTLSDSDKKELLNSLLDFQKGITQLGISPNYQNVVNGEISAAMIEAENEKPVPSKIKEKFESAIKTAKEAGKSIQDISELYEPAKKIAKLLGIGLSFLA
jgi:hypothetical protein